MKKLIIIISLICNVTFGQRIIVVDQTTGKRYDKELSRIIDTSKTKVIESLSPNLKIYKVLQKPYPAYDNLTEKLQPVTRFTDSVGFDEFYPYVVYDLKIVSLPDNIIKKNKEHQYEQTEMDSIYQLMSDVEFRKYVLISLGLLIDDTRNDKPTVEEYEILDKIKTYSDKTLEYYNTKTKAIDSLKVKNINIKN